MSPSGYLVNENPRSIDDDPPKWVRLVILMGQEDVMQVSIGV